MLTMSSFLCAADCSSPRIHQYPDVPSWSGYLNKARADLKIGHLYSWFGDLENTLSRGVRETHVIEL